VLPSVSPIYTVDLRVSLLGNNAHKHENIAFYWLRKGIQVVKRSPFAPWLIRREVYGHGAEALS
jgi:hypothetical protein